MSALDVGVTSGGIVAMVFLAWFFFGPKKAIPYWRRVCYVPGPGPCHRGLSESYDGGHLLPSAARLAPAAC